MIGGEFEVDLSMQRGFEPQPDINYYSSGRAALYQILQSIGPCRSKIWMPDWLCYSMIEAAKMASFEVHFYELDAGFNATVDALEKSGFYDGDVLLVVNYFGLQYMSNAIQAIKVVFPKCIVIEDDVQAFWYFMEKENPFADYRFTSLRKSFAIPDGGLVKTKHVMNRASEPNTFAPYKLKAALMKSKRGSCGIKDEDYLRLFEQGENAICNNYNSVISKTSERLFAGIDFHYVKKKRQDNAKVILDGLRILGMKPMIDVPMDSVPLFVPILLDNRDVVRERMFQNEVFCPIHWPLEDMKVKRGTEMAKHELSLIVDQRYGEKEMNLIINLLK